MMRKISIAILIVVGLFSGAVGATLYVKSRALRSPVPDRIASRADYRIKEVNLQENAGDVRWKLVADVAEIFESEGRTRLRRPVVDIEEPHRKWRVSADEGEVHQTTNDIVVRDNVILLSDDGLKLETKELRWLAKDKRLTTTTPVVLSGRGAVIRGTGLDVDVSNEHAVVRGRVRVVFDVREKGRQ
jgi:LPS export ABC transporter protein LptC